MTPKIAICAQLCLAISSQLRHVSTVRKNVLLNSNISSTSPRNMVNFGPLIAEILLRVWGTPTNVNRFRVLALLLHRRLSTEVNKTLQDVWPSPWLVHYVYIFLGLFPPNGILPGAKFTLRPSLAFSYIGSVTARHSSSGRQANFAAFSRGRHLYSTGRPSRWLSAHILVLLISFPIHFLHHSVNRHS